MKKFAINTAAVVAGLLVFSTVSPAFDGLKVAASDAYADFVWDMSMKFSK